MKRLFVPMALAAMATLAFAQAPAKKPAKQACACAGKCACNACKKGDMAACSCKQACPKKADAPKTEAK